jgi:excinuclease ABC subunit A
MRTREEEPGGACRKASPAGWAGRSGHTLYVLDEPTTGLHFEDIRKLCEVMNRWLMRATRW